MDGDFCELLRCCCECGLCIGLCCLCCRDNDSNQRRDPFYPVGPASTTIIQTQPNSHPTYPIDGIPPGGGYGGGNPYPPSMPMPQPQPGYPPHSGAPYPPPGGAPYPPGPVPGGYPPAGYPPGPGYQAQPPPYDVAVSMPPPQPYPPQPEGYVKQAPYNPHYQN
ncbi:unnamed protein product [Ceutorhynchus assimilis]|uniref:Uncharacterized protein n=1 Tax=Ceutorhynchus assimilis TaxID=467358 RepID=A0A9N9MJU8_9CUCU|nr:unnamed protein product [Ceutorhynchus assimilis]